MRVSEFDRIVAAELTRPSNTTAYSAGQVIAAAGINQILTFPNSGRSPAATGYFRSLRLLTSQSGCTAAISVWLYNAIPTIQADGTAFQNLWAERSRCLGHFTLPALQQYGSTDHAIAELWFNDFSIYSCAINDASLYAQLVTGTGFTPASGQVFRVELGLHQNEYQ